MDTERAELFSILDKIQYSSRSLLLYEYKGDLAFND